MPQDNYRYYCLDGAGQLHAAEYFYAENDEDAVAKVAAKHPDATWEVWQDRRLVASLLGSLSNDPLAASRRAVADARRTLRETASMVAQLPRTQSGGDAR